MRTLSRIFPVAFVAVVLTFTSSAFAQYSEKMLLSFTGGSGYGNYAEALLRTGHEGRTTHSR